MRHVALALGAIVALQAPAWGADRIVLHDGQTIGDVEIQTEGREQIEYRSSGRGQARRSDDVREIIHGDPSALYGQAEGARLTGRYADAIRLYEQAAQGQMNQGQRAWVPIYAAFRKGECQRLAGATDAAQLAHAVDTFRTFAEQNADHFLAARAIYLLGETEREKGDLDDARTTYERLLSGYGDYARMLGNLGKGMVLLAQGGSHLSEAAQEFQTVIGDAGADARWAQLLGRARLALGLTYIADSRPDQAQALFENICSDDRQEPAVMASALNGLGAAYAATPNGGDNAKKKALIAYLRVVVLYPGETEHYARALLESGRLYQQLAKPELAEPLFRELRDRCPNSPEARQIPGSAGGGGASPSSRDGASESGEDGEPGGGDGASGGSGGSSRDQPSGGGRGGRGRSGRGNSGND